MANVDRPHGAQPLYRFGGGNIALRSYPVAAANTAIGIGDFVTLKVAGNIDQGAASDTQIVGVAAHAKSASAGGNCLVYDQPDLVCEMQEDSVSANIALADRYANFNFVVAAASNGISQMEIDSDSANTTNTLPLKLIDLYGDPNNAVGANGDWVVVINNHVYKSLGVTGLTS